MYFLKDIINMLSEKKVSKKSPSKMNISSVLEQIGLLSRGKVSICSQGEALGGIAERPLTARIRTISGVAGTSFDVPAAAFNGELWGSGGKAPGSPGAGAVAPAGCGQSPRFVFMVIKRKLPPCGRQLPLNPLYGNIPVKVGSYFLRKSPPYP